MTERDYDSSPISDELNLKSIITGLANDLADLREGKISIQDAQARAQLAKQIWNGSRLYLQAIQTIQAHANKVGALK